MDHALREPIRGSRDGACERCADCQSGDNQVTTSKTFPLASVLSVTTGVLLCDIGKLYEILNFMTGDNLFTHQLPRARNECAPYLCEEFPALATIDTSQVTEDNWKAWLSQQIEQHGEYMEVVPLPEHRHEFIDPISELAETVHPSKICVIKTGDSAA
jgi:hypothetical protein